MDIYVTLSLCVFYYVAKEMGVEDNLVQLAHSLLHWKLWVILGSGVDACLRTSCVSWNQQNHEA